VILVDSLQARVPLRLLLSADLLLASARVGGDDRGRVIIVALEEELRASADCEERGNKASAGAKRRNDSRTNLGRHLSKERSACFGKEGE
jgi:hypothetical protein